MAVQCNTPVIGRRRTFWTTQACASEPDCEFNCETEYGIQLYCPDGGNCVDYTPGKGRSIVTDGWLKSLVVNILFTDGRRDDTACGWQPGARGGHWSDSYRSKDYPGTTGSTLRYLKPTGTVSEALQEVTLRARYDLQKLVAYGVADSIDVKTTYVGGNTARLDVIIYGVDGQTTLVGLSAKRLKNDWVWNT